MPSEGRHVIPVTSDRSGTFMGATTAALLPESSWGKKQWLEGGESEWVCGEEEGRGHAPL